jgi:hypothetical protein
MTKPDEDLSCKSLSINLLKTKSPADAGPFVGRGEKEENVSIGLLFDPIVFTEMVVCW